MQQAPPIPLTAASVGNRLLRTLSRNGYALITEHGIDGHVLDSARCEAMRFFALPTEEKLLCDIRRSSNHRGYVPFEEAGSYDDEGGQRRYESYDVGLDLHLDHETVQRGTPLAGPNVWPTDGRLRSSAQRCFDQLSDVADNVLTLLAVALGIDITRLEAERSAPLSQMRLINYHDIGTPSPNAAMGAHTDYEFLTLIKPDGPGLEVRNREHTWAPVPATEDSLVLLSGDLLEVASGGRLPSSLHRVGPAAGARFSTVFFAGADYDAIIQPMESSSQNSDDSVIDLRDIPTPNRPPAAEKIEAGPHLLRQLQRDFPYLRDRFRANDHHEETDSVMSDFELQRIAGQ